MKFLFWLNKNTKRAGAKEEKKSYFLTCKSAFQKVHHLPLQDLLSYPCEWREARASDVRKHLIQQMHTLIYKKLTEELNSFKGSFYLHSHVLGENIYFQPTEVGQSTAGI